WGTVVNTTNAAQPIGITSASWSVTDGNSNAVFTSQTRPPVRIFTQGNQSFYVLEVPFDTRRFGTIQLANPATEGINSFELLSSSPPTYILTPTVNGVLATVRSVDGAPSGAASVPVAGFNTTVRGRVIRVDLSITPTTETYEQWATRIFGSSGQPAANPNADPDHDGLTNAGEYAAGTNPLDPSSALRLLQIAVTGTQATVGWQSVASKQYVLESATNVAGPWTEAASVLAATSSAQASVPRSPVLPTFYRIRVVTP
ncbi:MAG TPA: thrombospondin type 3 repeat-containing protein, partial [Candidatus Dormibacteraeota bacterium]|nr:thrombospondin type 3 repeat-containing protein [Candidatus Dormibacteraeota bacterium]